MELPGGLKGRVRETQTGKCWRRLSLRWNCRIRGVGGCLLLRFAVLHTDLSQGGVLLVSRGGCWWRCCLYWFCFKDGTDEFSRLCREILSVATNRNVFASFYIRMT